MILDYYGYQMLLHLVFKNGEIECFVHKYLTIDQTMLSIEICNMQIHQHKRTCPKIIIIIKSTNLSISIFRATNETYKNIIAFRRTRSYAKPW
jgi:hypothetical protein